VADPLSPPSEDPFAQIDPGMSATDAKPSAEPTQAAPPATNDNEPSNPFSDLGPEAAPGQSGAVGSFARGAEKGALPATGSLAGAGAGAELGGALGTLVEPGLGSLIGGVVGGIGGGIFGAQAVQTAQNWAVKHLPESWQDGLGFSERQSRLDESQHSGASFLGGLAPYAVTMNPKAVLGDLPENATTLQKILAHPVGGRMFGGALMGGMEAGQEKIHDDTVSWPKVAIATVFGTVFNRPNKIGEAITETGASPTRTALGRPHPTLAQAADLKVMGPGITEPVFQGTQEQAPEAALTAQENARQEQSAIGEPPEPDHNAIARQMEPELFARYDELLKRRELFSSSEIGGEAVPALSAHLATTNAEIDRILPEVSAAYRRAADTTGVGTVPAEPFGSFAEMLAARENQTGAGNETPQVPQEREPLPVSGVPGVQPSGEAQGSVEGPQPTTAPVVSGPQRSIGEQRAFIANDVSRKLIAAGRPPEEAAAAGQLIAARYVTRAGRFAGKLGTAEELYGREGAAIAGPNERPQAPAMAPREPVSPPLAPGAAEVPPEDIKTTNVRKTLRGRAAADPRTWSLSEYLASKGGLKPDPELHAIYGGKKGPMIGGFGPLLQHAGYTLDEALRAAKDGHYMFDNADVTGGQAHLTPRDLLDLLDNENRGNKVYRNDYVPAEKGVNPEEERGSIIDALHHELHQADPNIKVDPALEDRVVEIIQKEGEHDVLAAYERAIMEDHDRYESLRDDRQASESIPGWDAPDSGPTSGAGAEHLGEGREAGVSPEAAREDHGGEPRDTSQGDGPPTSAIAAWDDLISQRLARRETLKPSGGYNTDRNRNGTLLRGKASQEWKPGNTVNVGFLKDLLVAKDNGDGSFKLLSKPDQNGMSRVYEMKPHEGISGNAKKVDFLEHAKDVLASHEMAQSVDEYFQRVYHGSDLFEAGAEGKPQQIIPGAEKISDAELAQRKADENLKPKVAQKPMDSGLFGDSMDQKELFQSAYHGSPYHFDMFDTGKIGTGEGNAAYGHGLYFAENVKIAEAYMRALAGKSLQIDGKSATPQEAVDQMVAAIKKEHPEFGVPTQAAQWVFNRIHSGKTPEQISRDIQGMAWDDHYKKAADIALETARDWKTDPALYRVDIKPDPEKFLQWDKPLSEQPKALAAFEAITPKPGWLARQIEGLKVIRHSIATDPESSGESAYGALSRLLGSHQAASAALKEAGLPGIRYLDAVSRGAGEGSHNYVVFDPKDIEILDRNGKKVSEAEYNQTARGKIRISPNARPIITLMKDANASTFVHESGHQFLEELMRDADHPDAPPELRDDAQTVRDWLGVTDDIKTKHHEKFARGFEQYLREGVAPSPELAGVFAKFRNWLLSIYQSIKGLGTEISPDIRSVFDRLLEQEPQRTVIAPERPGGGPLLHEVHEGDAAHAEPHEADALADRVAAESVRAEQEPPPEVANEIAASVQKVEVEQAAAGGGANAGAENGGGAGAAGQVEQGSGGPEPQSAGGGVGGGAGEERGSGSGAEAESAERPNSRSKLGDHAGTSLAPGPADLFGARESPFTDKAGNIRVENLTTREDVAQAIRDSAAENNDFIGDRRGVITDGQVMELADALGMDAASLNQRQLGQAFNAEQIVAARKLLIQSATNVSAAMKKAAIGTDEDVMAYAEAKDRHQLIQAQVAGITAEAGRALRAFRSIAGEETAQATDAFIKQATGKTLFQLRAEAKLGAQLQTPQQVSKFMQDAQKFNFGRVVLEYWINGLISGPATHMTYMVGNTISAIMKLPEAVASAGVSRVASALGREGTGTVAGEAGAMVRGAARGFAPALKASVDALRTGITTELPSEGAAQAALPFQPGSELAQGGKLDEAATFHEAMSAAFGLVRGMRDTVMSTAAMVAAGGVPGESLLGTKYSMGRATPDITYRGVPVLPLGAAVTLPGRGVAVLHSFYRSLVFSMEKNAMAYRAAVQEGHTGTALEARVAELRSDPSQEAMNEAAAHEATESALMGRGSELTQRLAALTNVKIFGAPLLKFIDPFVRVSGNIIDQSLIRRTPVGLLTMFGPETELARDLTGKNGNVAQDKAIGRMMVGTTLAVTFGSLAAQKLLSGSGPKDPKEAKIWMMAGNQPHSVRIGDTWYQVNKLGPVGMLASISADLYDVAHEAEEGDFTKAGAHLLHAITQNVLDESAMHGPAELLKAVETPDRYGESYVRNYLAAFVPYSVGLSQMARAMDPYQRDTKTMIDTIRNKIPGHLDSYFGNELPVRRDIWGEPLPSRTALGGAGISAIYEQKTNADPVNQAMWKVGVFPGAVERKIHNVPLTAEQYDDFQRLAGRMAKMRLDKMVISPQFQQQIPSVQHDWMNETIKQSRESARQMMMMKNPTIARQALEAKQSKKQAINDRNPDE
jgi:hypothetical protein